MALTKIAGHNKAMHYQYYPIQSHLFTNLRLELLPNTKAAKSIIQFQI